MFSCILEFSLSLYLCPELPAILETVSPHHKQPYQIRMFKKSYRKAMRGQNVAMLELTSAEHCHVYNLWPSRKARVGLSQWKHPDAHHNPPLPMPSTLLFPSLPVWLPPYPRPAWGQLLGTATESMVSPPALLSPTPRLWWICCKW